MTTTAVNRDPALERCLALIRLSSAAFLSVWALDKILGPQAAMKTFSFYYMPLSDGNIILAIGLAQLLLVIAFAVGAWPTLTYGAVTVMHAVSTVASWPRYLDPLARPNILFWAAVPVLAALIALFVLRNRDRLLTIGSRAK